MKQQILIIGLGHFGMSLARSLAEKGAEILAVDTNPHLVEEASRFVADAITMDATNESDLSQLEPWKRDVAVCSIGDDSKEASIIVTALLRQMGTKLVIARANELVHQRILLLVGAHQVINPEKEFGKRFANRLLYREILADTSLGEDFQVSEILVQSSFVGKSLEELKLPKRYGIMVVGIRRGAGTHFLSPSPSEPLLEGDKLLIVGQEDAIPNFLKGIK